MSRLYLRIYLAVIGSLAVFALLAALAAGALSIFDEEDRPGWSQTGAEIAERLLPPDRDPAALASELAFWQERTGFSLMLLSPRGKVIAKAGPFPADIKGLTDYEPPGRRFWRGKGGLHGLILKDGRRLIAAPPSGELGWIRHLGWLVALFGIGLAVAIAAYPLIRYLTRRLERLEEGVAAFGAGDLTARVDIPGRDEIAKLSKTFNATADRVEALLNAHKALLANASHELRSPLSRLQMAIERLSSGQSTEAARQEIARNIAELDDLIGEILLASRLQANAGSELEIEDIDLTGLLAEECSAFGAELDAERAGAVTIAGDARLLRRLFRNLLENVARYGGGEPSAVTANADGRQIRVSVCDRGPGVPEAEREKIFEPFYRLKNAPESAGGAGLGLSLVRQIAERHGGHVRCLARPGGGTCFEVSLPFLPKPSSRGERSESGPA
jgi:signal transduction histidine kinase